MDKSMERAARVSLSFLWISTGITSLFFAKDIGYEVLAQGGITGGLADVALISGSLLDIAIGIWLLTNRQLRVCYLLQLAVMTTYTLLLSVIAPHFWLHPFGPLTKNIPIAVLVFYLYRRAG